MKKGFTLIELLAVIVILALIALIATPIVLKIVDKANGKARSQTANNVLTAAKYFYMESILDENIEYPSTGLEFVCDKETCTATIGATVKDEGISLLSAEEPTTYSLKFSGKVPSSGSIVLTVDGVVTPNNLAVDSHLCTFDETKNVFTDC